MVKSSFAPLEFELNDNVTVRILTFDGKRRFRPCIDCGTKIAHNSTRCTACNLLNLNDKCLFKFRKKFNDNKAEFTRLWNDGMLIKDMAKEFQISIYTVHNWRKKLGLKPRNVWKKHE